MANNYNTTLQSNNTDLQAILNTINELPEASNGVELPTLTNEGSASDLLSGKQLIDSEGNIVDGTIATKTSSNLTASGATVTVPAGYYASNATKSVTTGSAKTPATTVTKNPTISVNSSGLITASVSGTQSVTPTVSAGYVSSGTAGTITVSGSATKQLTTQSAKTITPSTSSQTAVASGRYTTGAVTVAGDANLIAGNIKSGVSIFGVAGTYGGGGSSGGAESAILIFNGYYHNPFVIHYTKPDFSIGSIECDGQSGIVVAKGTIIAITNWDALYSYSGNIEQIFYHQRYAAFKVLGDCQLDGNTGEL